MTDESESASGFVSADELRRVRALCMERLREGKNGYWYCRPFTRRDVALILKVAMELGRLQGQQKGNE